MVNETEKKKVGIEFLKERNPKWTEEEIEKEHLRLQKRVLDSTPPRYENVKVSDIPSEVAKFVDSKNGKDGMYIWGSVGTGKTHILYALRKYYALSIALLRVHTFADVLQNIKDSFNEEDREDILDYADKFIGLDDVGVEKETEWSGEQLYRLVNYLYVNKKPFVFTSNLSLPQLAERYGTTGDRIASRIAEMANIVEIKGKDKRV